MATKSKSQGTVDKAGPTAPMSKGIPGNAPSEGVQSTAEVADRLERDTTPVHDASQEANKHQG